MYHAIVSLQLLCCAMQLCQFGYGFFYHTCNCITSAVILYHIVTPLRQLFCTMQLHHFTCHVVPCNCTILATVLYHIVVSYIRTILAAITAMNARSIIPKQPVAVSNKPQINQRSFIPKPFASKVVQSMPSAPANSFLFPARQMAVNGVEKSGIPRPQYQPQIMRPVAQRPVLKPAGYAISIFSYLFLPPTYLRACIHAPA